MTEKLILDCESFDDAVASLSKIFQTTPEALKDLLSAKEIGVHFERHWMELPDFTEYLYAVAEGHLGCPSPLDAVCWFHTTRIFPGTTFSEGILPLDAALPALKERLIEAVDDASLKVQLRDALYVSGVGDHHYANKTQNSIHWGPYAILVRDVASCAANLSQHDYLAMPEIIEDICNGFDSPVREELLTVFNVKLRPAVVKFTAPADQDEAYISTALCYVHSMIQEGKLDTNSVMCFDGENNPVPPHDILKVEFVDSSRA
jgi:hypothetical protein